jgi:uncharacterized membrane protein YgcG
MARTVTARPGPAAAAVPALTAAQVKAAKKKAAEDIQTFLEDVCGFNDEAAEAIVDDQGYSDLDELCRLDDKGADNLCSILRKSQTGPDGVVAGHSISNLAQERLKLAIFAMKHQKRVSREIDLSEMDKVFILALDQQRQMEKTFTNKLDGYSQATFKDLAKTFEVVSEQLEHGRGIHGVCLAYIVREDLIPPYEDHDPPTNYHSLDAEMIARAPILEDDQIDPDQTALAIKALEDSGPFCASFRIDMVTVWNILYEMFGQTPAWLHGQSTKKEKNGRKLFRLLFDHYLGAEHVTHQANKVEARIASLSYKGEQKNWGWDKYVDAHIEQHIIAKNLMPYGYSGIDERSKIRHLLGGISDPGLHPVTCNILAMKEEDKTFTKCATMYTDFIRACGNSMNPRQDRNGRQIASVHSGRGGGRGRGGGGRGDGRGRGGGGRGGGRSAGVPDQADVDKVNWLQANKYYTAKEYANFNPAEKAWIHQNRTEEKAKSPKRKVAAVRRSDEDAMDESDDNKSLFGDDDESVSSKKSNKGNPALARQQGKKLKN